MRPPAIDIAVAELMVESFRLKIPLLRVNPVVGELKLIVELLKMTVESGDVCQYRPRLMLSVFPVMVYGEPGAVPMST